MAIIKFKNSCEYALLIWLSSFPLSGHWTDEQRFMVFAKTVARYRSKKWLVYKNFEEALKSSKHPFRDEDVEKYYFKLKAFVDFHKTAPIQPILMTADSDYGYYQRGVIKGRIYEVPISKAEYFNGASKETIKKVKFLDQTPT